MNTFKLSQKSIPDMEFFHEALKVQFPDDYEGLNKQDGEVWVLLKTEITQNLIDLIEAVTPPAVPLQVQIDRRISYYQSIAPKLLREMYVKNTVNGITTAQSDQMMAEFYDVLLCLKEGLFPTARYRMNSKNPSGFVTQALIQEWKDKIDYYMGL